MVFVRDVNRYDSGRDDLAAVDAVSCACALAGIRQALVLGALWGWLPCGLVYSMLLLGTLGGSAAHGALTMLAFGAGTLPAMLSSNLLASQLARITALKGLRFAAGSSMLVFGVWTAWLALWHSGH